jgi:hypothetical protein
MTVIKPESVRTPIEVERMEVVSVILAGVTPADKTTYDQ